MPTTVDCPSPAAVVWNTASYVSVPERETMPIEPGEWMYPGMIVDIQRGYRSACKSPGGVHADQGKHTAIVVRV